MILAQKQIHSSMKQNTEFSNEPTHMGNSPTTKEVRIYNGEKTSTSINNIGKTGQPHAKESNWTTFSCHIQK